MYILVSPINHRLSQFSPLTISSRGALHGPLGNQLPQGLRRHLQRRWTRCVRDQWLDGPRRAMASNYAVWYIYIYMYSIVYHNMYKLNNNIYIYTNIVQIYHDIQICKYI